MKETMPSAISAIDLASNRASIVRENSSNEDSARWTILINFFKDSDSKS